MRISDWSSDVCSSDLIQEAKANEIKVTPAEVNQGFARVARNFEKTPDSMREYLHSIGSSDRTRKLQIEAELAWQRYLGQQVEHFVNVGEGEGQGILSRLTPGRKAVVWGK